MGDNPHQPRLLNTHHYGGVASLPSTAVYIGRPGPYGNAYSSQSGVYSKEECVARHRVDLYLSLLKDGQTWDTLQRDLQGKDLACWCVHPKRVKACHGMTYTHVLNHPERTYTSGGVVRLLMEDIRTVLKTLDTRVGQTVPQDVFLGLRVHLDDVKILIDDGLYQCRLTPVPPDILAVLLARICVDLELAAVDDDWAAVHYRFDRVIWIVAAFLQPDIHADHEPCDPFASKGKRA